MARRVRGLGNGYTGSSHERKAESEKRKTVDGEHPIPPTIDEISPLTGGLFPKYARCGNFCGYTLLEVVIATAVMGILVTLIYQLLATSTSSYQSGVSVADMHMSARRVLDEIAKDLLKSGSSVCSLSGTTSITFSKDIGYVSPDVVWGNQTTYALQYENGESNNGVDDNNNGLVDECVITQQLGSSAAVRLLPNVKENGLYFAQEGTNVIYIRITVQGLDDKRNVLEHTVETRVKMRN